MVFYQERMGDFITMAICSFSSALFPPRTLGLWTLGIEVERPALAQRHFGARRGPKKKHENLLGGWAPT